MARRRQGPQGKKPDEGPPSGPPGSEASEPGLGPQVPKICIVGQSTAADWGGPFSTLGRRIFIVPNRPASGTLLFSTAERRPPEGRTSRRERKGHRYDADMSKPRARILEWWAPLSTGMTGFGDPFREAMPGIPAGLRLFTMYPMYRFPPP